LNKNNKYKNQIEYKTLHFKIFLKTFKKNSKEIQKVKIIKNSKNHVHLKKN